MADAESFNEDFCKNKLILNPKEAGFCDIIRLLYRKNVKERSFVDCSEETALVDFERRLLIFISICAQKVLFLGRKMLARIGCVVETWLNLLLLNGGFIKLIYKFVHGQRVEWPNRYSPNYTSLLGNLDPRRDLDSKIRPGDHGYNSVLSIMAAKVAYENELYIKAAVTQHWKAGDYIIKALLSLILCLLQMAFYGYYEFDNAYLDEDKTRAFISHDQSTNIIMVSFKGTSPFNALEMMTDFDISWYEFEHVGKVHAGFMKALGLQKHTGWPKDIPAHSPPYAYYTLRKKLKELLSEHKEAKFAVTGHSLGAALALLFVTVLMFHEEEELLQRLEGVYTFGQPRVGDADLGAYMTRKIEEFHVRYHRYVYCNDMVARLPFDDKALMYKHFGRCLYFNSCYKEKVLREEPNKNYFSVWWYIPNALNACWELIRGFLLPYRFGPEYKENWVMKLARLIGILLPGLSAHIPRDYVNSTRLGLDHHTGPN